MKQRLKINFKKINEANCCFFEKINKSDEPLASLIKKKKKTERTQISKIRNEKEVTTDTTEIQRIIRDYQKQLYANKMDNLLEMDKLLKSINFLNEEEIVNMNISISSNEIKMVI